MSVQLSLWLASLLAAALFFVAGYLAALVARTGAMGAAVPHDAPSLDLGIQAAEADDAVAAARAELAKAMDALVIERGRARDCERTCRELQREKASLGLELEAARRARARPLSALSADPPLALGAEPREALRSLVGRLAANDAFRAVTVADPDGLVVTGVGERVEELAAASALVRASLGRAAATARLGAVRTWTLVDALGFVLQARALEAGETTLTLVTLAALPRPEPLAPEAQPRAD